MSTVFGAQRNHQLLLQRDLADTISPLYCKPFLAIVLGKSLKAEAVCPKTSKATTRFKRTRTITQKNVLLREGIKISKGGFKISKGGFKISKGGLGYSFHFPTQLE